MTDRRVVVTGLGAVCALGMEKDAIWQGMLDGRNGIVPIERFDASGHSTRIAGEVTCLDKDEHFPGNLQRKLDPFTMYGLIASDGAMEDSGLDLEAEDRDRFGCIMGSGIGGMVGLEDQHTVLLERGPRRVSPHFIPRIMSNAVSGQVAIRHGLRGTNFVTCSACAASGHAMGMALQAVRRGEVEVCLTGGAESTTTPLGLAGFCAAKALSTRNEEPERACRPFDADRDGFVMGEGAAVLVFEERERAMARGAVIYCEVKGFGSTDDAFHITAPEETGDGPTRAIEQALSDAGVATDDVDYVNAHGTSTLYNDRTESRALRRVFGDRCDALGVSSTKSLVGHLLGASAAIEAFAVALSVSQDVCHASRNYETPDPECPVDVIAGDPRELTVRNAISNSLGFGGHNVCLVFGK